jgi:hypothetical protein
MDVLLFSTMAHGCARYDGMSGINQSINGMRRGLYYSCSYVSVDRVLFSNSGCGGWRNIIITHNNKHDKKKSFFVPCMLFFILLRLSFTPDMVQR